MKKISNKKLYKKILTKFIGYITVLAIISSLFCVNIHAEEPENDTHLDTYAAHYFQHLIINFGKNEENTCSYVAAAMLLSFYDSYLNDSFISKDCNCASDCDCDYDVLGEIDSLNLISSPGIKREDPWDSDEYEEEYTDYNAFIDDYANEHFHLRLLQIGRDELGLYNPPTQNQRSSDSTKKSDLTGWEINIYEIGNVIQKYISMLSDADPNEVKIKNGVTIHISSYNDDEHDDLEDPNAAIRNEIIAKVKAGIPVIYLGEPVDGGIGHCMIAHDYDEATDTLYFHTGKSGIHTINDKETEYFIYTNNTAILWFEIGDGLVHSCSNNYKIVDSSTTEYLCACEVYSGSLEHEHDYNATIDNWDNRHFSRCICGKITNIEAHSLTYTNIYPTFHREECNECSYINDINHEYTVPHSPTATGHSLKCACGATSSATEAHYADTYEKLDSSFHNVYCECGYLIEFDFHSYIFSAGIRYCSGCGYVKPANPGPGQVIMGEDDEDPTTE